MTIMRPQILLTAALGLILTGFSTLSALAEHAAGHSHAAGHGHAAGHADDPTKAENGISKMLATLGAADRKQAIAQRFCPIMEYSRLGADGAPHKVMIGGTPVFVCCKGCIEGAVAGGKETLAKARKLTEASAVMAKMSAKERAAAEAQKYCAVANKNFLGSMGAPIKLELDGKPIYLCCKGCVAKAKADPAGTLAKVEALKKAGAHEDHEGSGHKDHGHGEHKH